ncbi:MAG: DUF1269 domain-containing protein [Gammaproteobacteria bacterium]|nr:DUF1269 domain-containing protein [Gammaproteobacteria bacterium]
MRRIYFLIPNIDLTETIINELERQGIAHTHLHVVASITQPLKDLPEATIWQRTELAHGLEWGTGIGGTAGLLGGLLTIAFPPGGIILGGGALLIGAAAGAGVGAAMLGLMKGHEHNHQLDDFKYEIEHGEILLMVDLPKTDVEHISKSILQHHPEAHIKVSEPR